MNIRVFLAKAVVLLTAILCTMAIAATISLSVPSVGNPQFVSSGYRSTQVALTLAASGLPYSTGDFVGATFNDGWKSLFSITGPANNLTFSEVATPVAPPQSASSGGSGSGCGGGDGVEVIGHWRYAGNEVDGVFYPTAVDYIVDYYNIIPAVQCSST